MEQFLMHSLSGMGVSENYKSSLISISPTEYTTGKEGLYSLFLKNVGEIRERMIRNGRLGEFEQKINMIERVVGDKDFYCESNIVFSMRGIIVAYIIKEPQENLYSLKWGCRIDSNQKIQ